jgi:hypothetical protein
MPILTGRISPEGPTIDIKVMQSPQRVAALKKANRPFASPSTVVGLIDTGASSSALDRIVIAGLDLQHRGVVSIHTPSTGPGYETRDEYDACLVLGETSLRPMVLTLPVIGCDFSSQGFLALIGRDVLRHCKLAYDGPLDLFTLEF